MAALEVAFWPRLQHGSLEKIAFRMDMRHNSGRCQVLVDGTPADLWQLSQKVHLELRASAPWEQFAFLFLPRSPGPPEGDGGVSYLRWQTGKYVVCAVLPPEELPLWEAGPMIGEPGAALARSMPVLLSAGGETERVGTLFGEEGEPDYEIMPYFAYSESESDDYMWLSE